MRQHWSQCASPFPLPRRAVVPYGVRMTNPDRDRLLFDLAMALRMVPRGILRDLGKRRLPIDGLAETIVAEATLEHLQLCGWRLEHKAKPRVTPGR